MESFRLTFEVNGKSFQLNSLDPETPLLWILRDHLGLTGTKYGCGQGHCGSCSVWVDGKRALSCQTKAIDLQGRQVTTIEGLAQDPKQKKLIDSWIRNGVPQCGYCQPGQLVTAAGLLKENPRPNADQIRRAMNQNLCRCGTYDRIFKAVWEARDDAGAASASSEKT